MLCSVVLGSHIRLLLPVVSHHSVEIRRFPISIHRKEVSETDEQSQTDEERNEDEDENRRSGC